MTNAKKDAPVLLQCLFCLVFACFAARCVTGELLQTAEVLKLASKDHRHKAWEESRSSSDSKSNDEDLEENQDHQQQHGNFSRWLHLELYLFEGFFP